MKPLKGFKQCSVCGVYQPVSAQYFNRCSNSPDGFRPNCKRCRRKYRIDNRSARSEKYKHFYQENAERLKEKNRQYYTENSERLREYRRQYVQDNHDAVLETQRRYYHGHKQYYRQLNIKWRKENPERHKLHRRRSFAKRRALLNSAIGEFSVDDIANLMKCQNGKCYYCGCNISKKYDIDHVIPLSRGGSNGIENIVLTCASCNRSKGGKLPHEWAGTDKLL